MGTRTILMVNPNTNTGTTEVLVDTARIATAGSGFTVVGTTARSGPRMIVDADALASAAAPTISAALDAVSLHNPSAIIVGAFGDPGVEELRTLVDVPVVGIGRASIARAATGRRRFAVATTTGELAAPISALVRTVSPNSDFAGVFLSSSSPLALASDPEATVSELGIAVDRAVAAGCDAVIIGGGPLSEPARRLALRTDVVIIEPVPSAVLTVLDELHSTTGTSSSA